MPKYSFTLNGKKVAVDAPGDLSVLWALRDKLGVTGPKYGCGINVCKACTSHINGKAFNPCAVRVADIKATDEITTIEGLADAEVGPAAADVLDRVDLRVRGVRRGLEQRDGGHDLTGLAEAAGHPRRDRR